MVCSRVRSNEAVYSHFRFWGNKVIVAWSQFAGISVSPWSGPTMTITTRIVTVFRPYDELRRCVVLRSDLPFNSILKSVVEL